MLLYREYNEKDISAMTSVWTSVFGDGESFVRRFIHGLKDYGTAVVAEENGTVLGCAYVIRGQELVFPDVNEEHGIPIAYVYAVAVSEEARGRGIGKGLCKKTLEFGSIDGDKNVIFATLPAEDRLYSFYSETLGTENILMRQKKEVSSPIKGMCMRMSSTEYMLWRENFLRDKVHVRLSNHLLEQQKLLLESYGGGFYLNEYGFAACCMEDGVCIIKELLCRNEELSVKCANLLAAELGCGKAVYYTMSETGEKYAVLNAKIPPVTEWNLTLD